MSINAVLKLLIFVRICKKKEKLLMIENQSIKSLHSKTVEKPFPKKYS